MDSVLLVLAGVKGFFGSALTIVCVILLFTLAIFIHEFGHYIAARLLGLQVDAFSIGFGPAIWKKTIKGIEYKIGWILFGGYVALPQLDPTGMEKVQGDYEEKGEKPRALPDVAPWKRIVVSFAGPLGNVVLAVFVAFLIAWLPGSNTGVVDTRVGAVKEETPAWKAGLRAGDRIVRVNGNKAATWNDMMVEWQLAGDAQTATFEVESGGTRKEMELPFKKDELLGLKILDGVAPDSTLTVGEVMPGSPAEAVGLRPKDVVIAVDDTPVQGPLHMNALVMKRGEHELTLRIRRGKEELKVPVTPRFDEAAQRPLIGIQWAQEAKAWMMYRAPSQQLKWDSLSIVRVLRALVAPKSKGERKAVAENIGGPVLIIRGLYSSVRDSMIDGLGFLRMICVNLALLNLLPIPVLDGGHIVFALYEIITRRKPHAGLVTVLVNMFAVLLIGLMLVLVYRDVVREVKFGRAVRALEQRREQEKRDGQSGEKTFEWIRDPAPAPAK